MTSNRIALGVLIVLALTACGRQQQGTTPLLPPAVTQAAPAPASIPAASSTAAAAPASAATPATSTTAAPAAASTAEPEVAGQVAVAEGDVTDTSADGTHRTLKDGDLVYPGDAFTVGQDSYLDLDFEDGGRILLHPGTTFQIQSYHFEPSDHPADADATGAPLIKPSNPQPENAFFRLVKGGLRAIDGLIGQTHHENYGIETPVATIGVRGTAFDVRYCGDDCKDENSATGKAENGLYTSVSDGSIGIKNDSGETVTRKGQSGFVRSRGERLRALTMVPRALRNMGLPERLKARATKNRAAIKQQRRQRIQRRMERRRQVLQQRRATGVRPPASMERREQSQQRREQRKQLRQEQEQRKQQVAAPAGRTNGEKRRERMQQRRERRKQRREQEQPPPPKEAAPQNAVRQKAEPRAKSGDAQCKGKKRRRRDKGKCDGG